MRLRIPEILGICELSAIVFVSTAQHYPFGNISSDYMELDGVHCALLWPVSRGLKKGVNIAWFLTLFVLIMNSVAAEQQPKRCMTGDKLRCEYEIPFGMGQVKCVGN